MKRGNHSRSRFPKALALVLAMVLLVGAAIGGTVAWLLDKTDPVVNTFTTSDVDITLTETDADEDKDDLKNSYQMIPGYTIAKDPLVTVLADSEKCWLFVKLEKSSNFDSFMTYEMADGWEQLVDAGGNAVAGVFCRVVEDTNADQPFAVIKGNTVTVKDTVTKADMDGLTASNYPTLTVTAYACQYNNSNTSHFEAIDAWLAINPPATP